MTTPHLHPEVRGAADRLLSLVLGGGSAAYDQRGNLTSVVDAAGALTGLVTSETIGEMIMVRDAMPKGARFGPWGRPAGA